MGIIHIEMLGFKPLATPEEVQRVSGAPNIQIPDIKTTRKLKVNTYNLGMRRHDSP